MHDRRSLLTSLALTASLCALTASTDTWASERRFAYMTSTDVLSPGDFELEPWSTLQMGREDFYFRMDHKVELEVGVTDWVQSAFYLKMRSTTKDVRTAAGIDRKIDSKWNGIAWEWKFKLADAVADPVGFGLYVEPGISPDEGRVEAKVLLDKRAGDVYFAYNLIGEYEADFGEPSVTEHKFKIYNVAGLAYFFTPTVALGLEVRNATLFDDENGFKTSTFFIGPTVSFSQERWWVALNMLPQIASIKSAEAKEKSDSIQDLDNHERFSVRILLGYHL
jgi:hypothetical protein